MKPVLLLVEDDADVVRMLSGALAEDGIDVRVASDAVGALRAVDDARPDVTVLSLDLAGDPLALARRVHGIARTPLLVLSADASDPRRVRALDEGADDCITKPFSIPEVLARVRVALRHRRSMSLLVDEAVVEFAGLRVDPRHHAAEVHGRPLRLTPKEFAVLAALARGGGAIVRNEVLLAAASSEGRSVDTLRHHVSKVRQALARIPAGPQVHTEQGIGYRLGP